MEKKLGVENTVMLSILHTYEENKKEVCKQPLNLTKKIIDFLVTLDPALKKILAEDFLFLQNSDNDILKKLLSLLFVERTFYRLNMSSVLVLKFERLNRFSSKELNTFVELLKTNEQEFLYYIRIKSASEFSIVFIFTEELKFTIPSDETYVHSLSFYERYWGCGSIEHLKIENLLHFLIKDIADFFTDVHFEQIVNSRVLRQITLFFESNILSDSLVRVSPAVRAYELFLENKASGCSHDIKHYSDQLKKYGYGFYVTLANSIVREKFKEFKSFFTQFEEKGVGRSKNASDLFHFLTHLYIKGKPLWHRANTSIFRAFFTFLVYMFLNLSNNAVNSGVNLYYMVAYHSIDFLGLLDYIGTAYKIQIFKLEGLNRFQFKFDDPIRFFYAFGVKLFYKMIVLLSNYIELRYPEDEFGNRVEDQFAILFKEDFIYKQKDDDRFALLRMNFGYRNLMVVPPVDWKYSPSGVVKGGGYLVNKYELVRPYPHNFLRLSEFYVNIINKLQSQALVIATDYFNFINDNLDCFFSKEDLKVKKQKRVLLVQEKQKNWNDIVSTVKMQQAAEGSYLSEQAFKDLGAKGLVALYYKGNKNDPSMGVRYDEINSELSDLNSELAEYETFVRIRDYLMDYIDIKFYRLKKKKSSGENEFPKPKINAVYFPYTYDFRGRIYPYTSELNYMSNSFGKSLFKSYSYEFFNFEIFKVYAYKCFKDIKSSNDVVRTLYHNDLHDRLLNFRKDLSLFKDAGNRFGLLSCALELEKYTRYVAEHGNDLNYRSNFLIGVDAHCSGAQIMALLLKDLTALRALNLNVERPEDAVNDYYLSVIKDYTRFLDNGGQFGELGSVFYNEFTYARDLLFNNKVLIHLFSKGNERELRKFFKNSIMTFAYGVTISTYTDRIKTIYNTYVRQVMKEPELLREKNYSFNGVYMFFKSFYTYYHRNNLIGQLYTQLQTLVGNVSSKDGVTFSLPTGGQVRQKYVVFKSVRKQFRNEIFKNLLTELERLDFNVHLPKSISISFIDPDNINTSKQRTAFPANFVHSLDSSILLFVLNELFLLNRFVLPIHDCFMVHTSSYYSLVSVYNQQLILLFLEEYDVIDNLIESLIKMETKDKKLFLDIYAKLKELRSRCTPEELDQLKRNISMSLYSLAISE